MSFSPKSRDEGRESCLGSGTGIVKEPFAMAARTLLSLVLCFLLVNAAPGAQSPPAEGAKAAEETSAEKDSAEETSAEKDSANGQEAPVTAAAPGGRPEGGPGKLLPQKQPQPRGAESGADRNRERWEKLPPEKRKRIESIYQQLRQLPAEERALLLGRLRAMDASERRSFIRKAEAELEADPIERHARLVQREMLRKRLEKLSPAEREKFKSLSPKERQEYLKRGEASRREKVISSLPEPLREKVRSMAPEEQAEFLKARKVDQILKDTFRDAEELQRIRGLPPKRIMDLVRTAARREKGAPKGELQKPDYVCEETWKRWLALKPVERAWALSALKRPPPRKTRRRGPPRDPGIQGAAGKRSKR
jgi:hypothetical protein